jgi:hypothetical protein
VASEALFQGGQPAKLEGIKPGKMVSKSSDFNHRASSLSDRGPICCFAHGLLASLNNHFTVCPIEVIFDTAAITGEPDAQPRS